MVRDWQADFSSRAWQRRSSLPDAHQGFLTPPHRKDITRRAENRVDSAEGQAANAVTRAAGALNRQAPAPTTAPSAGAAGLPGGETLVGMLGKLTTAVDTKDAAIADQDNKLKDLQK